jgi:hypothetical protein
MKWFSFVSCFLAAGSLVVFPELSLAHGGGGFGGGGGGGHGFGGGGFGGHGFGRGGFGGHGFSRSFASVSVRGFGSGPRGARGFADRGFVGRGGRRRFGDRGFRDRRFRDFDRGLLDFGFSGFGYPYYYSYDYSYYYPDSDYSSDAYLGADNSEAGQSRESDEMASLVQAALARRGYYSGPIDGIIGVRSRRAIRSFQSDQGLPVTGSIDGKLIKTLRIG